MNLPYGSSAAQFVLPVLFIVSFLAIVLVFFVGFPEEHLYDHRIKPKKYHTSGFDFGSFKRDFLILAGIALPFIIVYLIS